MLRRCIILMGFTLCIAVTVLPLAALADGLQRQSFVLPDAPPTDWQEQARLYGWISAVGTESDSRLIDWIARHQLALSSGFLLNLSRRLLERDPAQALEWYVVGLVRAQYDALRCRDDTAKRAVTRLLSAADMVARYGRAFPREFAAAGQRALTRPDLLAHSVSPDWICAQGLTGMGGHSIGILPDSQWSGIEQRLRRDYGQQFTAMSQR